MLIHITVSLASRKEKLSALVSKYTQGLTDIQRVIHTESQPPYNIIVTGTTGYLGTLILQLLLESPQISTIYALNRSPDAPTRQHQSLPTTDLTRVTFLTASLDKPQFGLNDTDWQTLLANTHGFIHNAWTVDFNLTVSSFEPHLAGVRNIAEFCAQSTHGARLLFESSIASVGNFNAVQPGAGAVPEVFLADHELPQPQGYGESKHVAAHIIDAASKALGIQSAVVRVGQLAGPRGDGKGVWNKREWVPSLIATSKAMGVLPESLGPLSAVDWVPIDAAAGVVVELMFEMFASEASEMRVWNLTNPNLVDWSALAASVQEFYGAEAVKLVSYNEWITELKKVPQTKEEAEKKPGIRLLDFYEGLASAGEAPTLATTQTTKASATLAGIKAIDGDLMGSWLKAWEF